MSASKNKPDITDYLALAELARDKGVTTRAVHGWLKRADKHRYPYYWRVGQKGFVRLDVAATYAAARLSRRPKGWLTFKQLADQLEGRGRQFFTDQIAAGKVRIERYGGNVYIHPEDAAWMVRAYRELLPPQGAVLLTAFARGLGRTPKAVSDWAKRNGVSAPLYRHPTTGHPVYYLAPTDAERYARLALERGDRHQPKERPELRRAA